MKNIWENSTTKILVFLGTGILIPAGIQFISENVLNFKFLEGQPFLAFLVYCAVFTAITFLVIGMIYLIKFLCTKRDYFDETNLKIKGICKLYTFKSRFKNAEGNLEDKIENMYSLPDSNKIMHESSNIYGNKNEKKEAKTNIIYYGFSAKKYLNWIDYVYLNFLRKVKDKLKCKVVISLHYPDYIKECKINDEQKGIDKDPNEYVSEYKKVVNYFSHYVKKIIGDDVIIKTEDQFYKENVKKYAEDFHNVYVAMSLYYANKIGSEYNGKVFTYKDYKRKLSHIESAFPTWMMGIKSKHDRVYVLDNKLSQQIWDIEPLKTIRKEHDIYFIEVADLNNNQGLRLDVHKKGNCINLTDTESEIKRKIQVIDNAFEKQMMISLLDEGLLNSSSYRETSEVGIDQTLEQVLHEIIVKYAIKPTCDELEQFGLEDN